MALPNNCTEGERGGVADELYRLANDCKGRFELYASLNIMTADSQNCSWIRILPRLIAQKQADGTGMGWSQRGPRHPPHKQGLCQ